jgi:hypothetical protein
MTGDDTAVDAQPGLDGPADRPQPPAPTAHPADFCPNGMAPTCRSTRQPRPHQQDRGLRQAAERRKLARQAADIIASNARSARKALASAASGSYKRPRLVNPSPKYDPDA